MKDWVSLEFRNDSKKVKEKFRFKELHKYASLIGKLCRDEMIEDFYLLIDYSEIALNLLKNEVSGNWLEINQYENYFKVIKNLLIINSIENEELHKELNLLRVMLREKKKNYNEFRITQEL